jgi:hypothetical protein
LLIIRKYKNKKGLACYFCLLFIKPNEGAMYPHKKYISKLDIVKCFNFKINLN